MLGDPDFGKWEPLCASMFFAMFPSVFENFLLSGTEACLGLILYLFPASAYKQSLSFLLVGDGI